MLGTKPFNTARLEREIMAMKQNPAPGISCYPSDDQQKNVLTASIVGTSGSPYEKGVFQLEVIVTERYPFEPPRVRFVTPIYHPNVDAVGRICMDMLKMPPSGSWKPTFTIEGLLTSIQYLITHPNPDDPLMPEVASQYKYSKEQFDKDAEEWTVKYANLNKITVEYANRHKTTSCLPLTEPQASDERESKRKSDIDDNDNSDSKKRPKVI